MPKSKKNRAAPSLPAFKNQPLKALSGFAVAVPEEPSPPELPPEHVEVDAGLDDADLFRLAMSGVDALPERPTAPEPRVFDWEEVDEDAEAAYELLKLVEERLPFDLIYTDETVEGRARGVSAEVVRRLKRGDYAIQATLDLHGRTRTEAREGVERFIRESRQSGKRCVRIIHGRGLNSKDQTPVLKEALRVWFEQGRGSIGSAVLAFCSARPSDGGWGAMYVLLRKPTGRP